MENFLKLIHALGRLDEIDLLLKPPAVQSFQDLEQEEIRTPKRGTV